MQKEQLFGKTIAELQDIVKELKLPQFTAKQIADWLYKKKIASIDEMSNLSKKARALLNQHYVYGLSNYEQVQTSIDGTKKYLFKTQTGHYIETAMIPDKDRATICVSSQMGCKMNCLFCATGKQGWQGNLSANEILNQLRMIDEFKDITNMVFMGMGEPLDNLEEVLKTINILTSDYGFGWSPKRITVSSIGVTPKLKQLLDKSDVHIAISLHNPFAKERSEIMPVEKAYALNEVLDTIKLYDFSRQRRVSFEYIVFESLNDTEKHAEELARILNGIKCRINLIRFHAIPNVPLKTTNEERLLNFQSYLKNKGIMTTIRASRGEDIFAACGLLSTKELLT